jgi:uncharacterized membrane protein YccC
MLAPRIKGHIPVLRQGLRMAVAATIAMTAVELLGFPSGFWAPLSALAVLQGQIGASLVASRNYIIASVTGVLLGALLVSVFGDHLLVAGFGIFVIATLATLMRLPPVGASVAAGVVPVLVLLAPSSPWRYGAYRIADILLGLASAILVSLVLWPTRAVVELRRAVGAAVADAAGMVSASLRGMVAGATEESEDLEARIAARLLAAQGLLPAARQEPLTGAAHDVMPFYLSDAERIFEHASLVCEVAHSTVPRDAVQHLAHQLTALATAADRMGAALSDAITAGLVGTPATEARTALASLQQALRDLRAVDLAPLATGDSLLRLYSFVLALDAYTREVERLMLRIEQPERALMPGERARMVAAVPAPAAASGRRTTTESRH